MSNYAPCNNAPHSSPPSRIYAIHAYTPKRTTAVYRTTFRIMRPFLYPPPKTNLSPSICLQKKNLPLFYEEQKFPENSSRGPQRGNRPRGSQWGIFLGQKKNRNFLQKKSKKRGNNESVSAFRRIRLALTIFPRLPTNSMKRKKKELQTSASARKKIFIFKYNHQRTKGVKMGNGGERKGRDNNWMIVDHTELCVF